jgi:hypothetical protein
MVNLNHNGPASETVAIAAEIFKGDGVGRQPGSPAEIGFLNLGVVE